MYNSAFLAHFVLILGTMSRFCMVLFSLKCTCMPRLLQVLLNFSLSTLVYDTIVNMFLFLKPVLLVLLCQPLLAVCELFVLCLWFNFNCRLLRALGGNLHANSALLMCSLFCCSVGWLVQTTLALCANVLKMLF